jgi:nicotinamidase-related amidase
MMRAPTALTLLILASCTGLSEGSHADGGALPDSRAPTSDAGVPPESDALPGPPPPVTGRAGLVLIDVQQSFVKSASNPDLSQILERTRSALLLAAQRGAPVFITYEATTQNALPATVQSAVPAGAQEFVKTTFAATGLPAFASAVQQSGLTHLVVLGAETDVCVLQTVLGLRALGLGVVLQKDAVFSEETNTAPALRRMRQAGASLASAAEVSALLGGGALPALPAGPIRRLKPFAVATVLNQLDPTSLTATQDPHKAAKQARLRELLLASEWFGVPIFGTTTSLPASLAGLLKKPIRPLAELAAQQGIEQVVIAGTAQGLAPLIAGQSREVFLLEDGLLGTSLNALEPDVQRGAVPLTYKTFYYEMTRSVSLSEWPSDWVARDSEYYQKTQAPEDLPPIPN